MKLLALKNLPKLWFTTLEIFWRSLEEIWASSWGSHAFHSYKESWTFLCINNQANHLMAQGIYMQYKNKLI